MIEVVGGPLMGKTTAIEYLDRVFAAERHLALLDPHARLQNGLLAARITVSTLSIAETAATLRDDLPFSNSLGKYLLAPWGQDEWIEYLLAAHKGWLPRSLGGTARFSLAETA